MPSDECIMATNVIKCLYNQPQGVSEIRSLLAHQNSEGSRMRSHKTDNIIEII
jgi:hypothetical protein